MSDAKAKPLGWMTQLILVMVVSFVGCNERQDPSVTCRILVAASAHEATQQAVNSFLRSSSNVDHSQIVLVSGPSNGLSQQILSGAAADIFVSANPKWTASIADQCDLIEEFVGNRLVLATHRLNDGHTVTTLDELNNADESRMHRIAIAAESVPLGDYARQAIGQSNELQQAVGEKLVFGKDASALLAWLESREADYGFIYDSDLKRSANLKEAVSIDPASHDPITYSIAKVKNDQSGVSNSTLRDQVYAWLCSEVSMQIYEDAGFVPMTRKPPAVSNAIE